MKRRVKNSYSYSYGYGVNPYMGMRGGQLSNKDIDQSITREDKAYLSINTSVDEADEAEVIRRRDILEQGSKYRMKPFQEKPVEREMLKDRVIGDWTAREAKERKLREVQEFEPIELKTQQNRDERSSLASFLGAFFSRKETPEQQQERQEREKREKMARSNKVVREINVSPSEIEMDVGRLTNGGQRAMKGMYGDLKSVVNRVKPFVKELPASNLKFNKELIYALDNKKVNVIMIQGSTGSGKTFMIPRMVAKYFEHKNDGDGTGRVVVTEPVKMNVRKTAKDVGRTFRELDGWSYYGYAHRGEKENLGRAKVLYMTDGYLIATLINDPMKFLDYQCIIIDEAHERTQNIDLLLWWIKMSLERTRQAGAALEPIGKKIMAMKFIIMSATMDITPLLKYFYHYQVVKMVIGGKMCGLKILDGWEKIGDDGMLFHDLGSELEVRNMSGGSRDVEMDGDSKVIDKVLAVLREIKKKYLDTGVKGGLGGGLDVNVCSKRVVGKEGLNRDILVFLPKKRWIDVVARAIEAEGDGGVKWLVHKLWSGIGKNKEIQMLADNFDEGAVKVILATDVAQTGVTIPSVKFVVDCGVGYFGSFNFTDWHPTMTLNYINKHDAVQRAGRAGRVQDGIVYQVYPKGLIGNERRIGIDHGRLDELIFKLIGMKIGVKRKGEVDEVGLSEAVRLLGDFPKPPKAVALRSTLDYFSTMKIVDSRMNLTKLGKCVLDLGLQVDLAMLVMLGLGKIGSKRLGVLVGLLKVLGEEGVGVRDWVFDDAVIKGARNDKSEIFAMEGLYYKYKAASEGGGRFKNLIKVVKDVTKSIEEFEKKEGWKKNNGSQGVCIEFGFWDELGVKDNDEWWLKLLWAVYYRNVLNCFRVGIDVASGKKKYGFQKHYDEKVGIGGRGDKISIGEMELTPEINEMTGYRYHAVGVVKKYNRIQGSGRSGGTGVYNLYWISKIPESLCWEFDYHQIQVVFHLVGDPSRIVGGRPIHVLVASDMKKWEKGLGGIEKMGKGKGMLFDLEKEHTPNFVNKGMKFDFKWIGIDSKMRVVEVIDRVSAKRKSGFFGNSEGEDVVIRGKVPIRYALEVNVGELGEISEKGRIGYHEVKLIE